MNILQIFCLCVSWFLLGYLGCVIEVILDKIHPTHKPIIDFDENCNPIYGTRDNFNQPWIIFKLMAGPIYFTITTIVLFFVVLCELLLGMAKFIGYITKPFCNILKSHLDSL